MQKRQDGRAGRTMLLIQGAKAGEEVWLRARVVEVEQTTNMQALVCLVSSGK
jgi:hypothetical protein